MTFRMRLQRGFTLLEILMAMAACAMILAAIYGVFSKAVKLRDDATARIREVRIRARAATVLRNDLRNALVSGGTMAAVLQGARTAPDSSFPGYLKFITTTAPDSTDEVTGELQEVAYYIVNDPVTTDPKAGLLVRAVEQNLLASVRETPLEEPLLAGVESLEVAFYDGQSWQDSWEVTTEQKTLPEGVRVRIQLAPLTANDRKPAPIEVLVPWTTQPAIDVPATTGAAPATGGTSP